MNSFQLILFLSLSRSLSLSLPLSLSVYELYLIKTSYFTENMIFVKLDLEAVSTADSYHLKSGTIYSQSYYLSQGLRVPY